MKLLGSCELSVCVWPTALHDTQPRTCILDTILSYNYWLTNVYWYHPFLSVRHKSLCPRHELDVTKMAVINLGCWLWLIVFSGTTMFGNSFPDVVQSRVLRTSGPRLVIVTYCHLLGSGGWEKRWKLANCCLSTAPVCDSPLTFPSR